MSDLTNKGGSDRSRGSASALDRLVREAKQDPEPRLDDPNWAAMEDRLMARLAETERSPLVDEVNVTSMAGRRRARVFQMSAAALAVAAALAFFVRSEQGGALVDTSARTPVDPGAGSLQATEGGEVRVDGRPASPGHILRAGDVVEVDGARAVLERPRKVMWLLERGDSSAPEGVARAHVTSANESLVIGLDEGAIEAQVTPVASGEAFAVDIATDKSLVRVAVHGTHLRVARTGTRVIVDLTEGVVSIGAPPRTGSTYGTLVTAPSHVEFDASNLEGTLKIDHAPRAVRAPVPLSGRQGPSAMHNETTLAPPHGPATPVAPATAARPALPDRALVADSARSGSAAKAAPGKPVIPPREAIAQAVRDCAMARHRSDNVRVTVTSSLTLKIAASGEVETAQFVPPLLPEVQTCAAAAIYKVKMDEAAGGSVMVPIDFTY